MTEQEWLECTDPEQMLLYSQQSISDAKSLFLGAACHRRLAKWYRYRETAIATNLAEMLAEGTADPNELRIAHEAATDCRRHHRRLCALPPADGEPNEPIAVFYTLDSAVILLEKLIPIDRCISVLKLCRRAIWFGDFTSGHMLAQDEDWIQCELIREILGPLPFHPIAIDPRWLTSTVIDLAQTIYTERAFDQMPSLADALMDAGCDHEEIIDHCRNEGPHVRGCFVIDLLLGK